MRYVHTPCWNTPRWGVRVVGFAHVLVKSIINPRSIHQLGVITALSMSDCRFCIMATGFPALLPFFGVNVSKMALASSFHPPRLWAISCRAGSAGAPNEREYPPNRAVWMTRLYNHCFLFICFDQFLNDVLPVIGDALANEDPQRDITN